MRRPLLAASLLPLALAGCGAERAVVPVAEQPADPSGRKSFRTPGGDVALRHPANWLSLKAEAPSVVHLFSGSAVATVWAYGRPAVPSTRADMRTARRRLVRGIPRRDPGFRVESSRLTRVDGAPAAEIVASGRIEGREVRVLSVHVYKGTAEYVFDAFSPPGDFERVRTAVFEPIIESIELGGDPSVEEGEEAPPAGEAAPGEEPSRSPGAAPLPGIGSEREPEPVLP